MLPDRGDDEIQIFDRRRVRHRFEDQFFRQHACHETGKFDGLALAHVLKRVAAVLLPTLIHIFEKFLADFVADAQRVAGPGPLQDVSHDTLACRKNRKASA